MIKSFLNYTVFKRFFFRKNQDGSTDFTLTLLFMLVVLAFSALIFIQTVNLFSLNQERDRYLSNKWNRFYDLYISDVTDDYEEYRDQLINDGNMIFNLIDPHFPTVISIKSENNEIARIPVYRLDEKTDTSLINLLVGEDIFERHSIYLQKSIMNKLGVKEDDLVLIRKSKDSKYNKEKIYKNYKFPLFVKEIKGETRLKAFIFDNYLDGRFGRNPDKIIRYEFESDESMFSFLFNALSAKNFPTPYYLGIESSEEKTLNNLMMYSKYDHNYMKDDKNYYRYYKEDMILDRGSYHHVNTLGVDVRDSITMQLNICGKSVSKTFDMAVSGKPVFFKYDFENLFRSECSDCKKRYFPYQKELPNPMDCSTINLQKGSSDACDFILDSKDACETLNKGIIDFDYIWKNGSCQEISISSNNECWEDRIIVESVDALSKIRYSPFDLKLNERQCSNFKEYLKESSSDTIDSLNKIVDIDKASNNNFIWKNSSCQTWESTYEDVDISDYYIQFDFDRYIQQEDKRYRDSFHENILDHASIVNNIKLFHKTSISETDSISKKGAKAVFAHYNSFENDSLNKEILLQFNEANIRWDSARWSQFIDLQNNIKNTQNNILRLIIINLFAFILVLVIKFMLRLKLELHLLGVLKCFGYSRKIILSTYNFGNFLIIICGFLVGYFPFGIIFGLISGYDINTIIGLYSSYEMVYGIFFLGALIACSLFFTTVFIHKYTEKENIYELIKYEG